MPTKPRELPDLFGGAGLGTGSVGRCPSRRLTPMAALGVIVWSTIAAAQTQGGGLLGTYTEPGSTVTVIDRQINFVDDDWSADVHGTGLVANNSDAFDISWEGELCVTVSDTYIFTYDHDDGATLEIDLDGDQVLEPAETISELIISNTKAEVDVSAGVALNTTGGDDADGCYDIRVTLTNDPSTAGPPVVTPNSTAILMWESGAISPAEVIPAANFQLTADQDTAGNPVILSQGLVLLEDTRFAVQAILDQYARAVLEWGPTAAYGSSITYDIYADDHVLAAQGLSANTLYHYRLTVTDPSGAMDTTGDLTVTTAAAAPPAGQGGIPGHYQRLSGGETYRIDRTLNFPLQPVTAAIFGGDLAASGNRNFTVTWDGLLVVDTADTYTFTMSYDDTARVWIDQRRIVMDTHVDDAVDTRSGSIYLPAGVHRLVTISNNRSWDGNQEFVLSWGTSTVPSAPIGAANLLHMGNLSDTLPPAVDNGGLDIGVTYQTDTLATVRVVSDELTTAVFEWADDAFFVGSGGNYDNSATYDHIALDHVMGMTGLTPGTTYHWRVTLTDVTGLAGVAGHTTVTADRTFVTDAAAPPPEQLGISGTYVASGGGQTYRVDRGIDFPLQLTNNDIFGVGIPAPGNHYFKVAWQGSILIDQAEVVTFHVNYDDTMRLVVDDRLITHDAIAGDAVATQSGSIYLEPGWHRFVMDVTNRSWDSNQEAILRWESPSITIAPVPQDHLAPAAQLGDITDPVIDPAALTFKTDTTATLEVGTDELATVTFSWGTTSGEPYPNTATLDRYGVVHSAGLTGLTADTDYYWRATATDLASRTTVGPELSFRTDAAAPPVNQTGLFAVYSSGAGAQERIDGVVNFPIQNTNADIFGSGLSAPGNHYFNVTWRGSVLIDTTEDWTFRVQNDDTATLKIDDTAVFVDTTSGDAVVTNAGTINLAAGWHAIELTVNNRSWDSNQAAVLLWESASQALEVIPQDHLQPAGGVTDSTAPTVIDGGTLFVTDTTATVRVELNEAAVALFEWSTDMSLSPVVGSTTVDLYRTDHTITMTGLSPGTTYYWQVTVADLVGNRTTDSSFDNDFDTDAAAPPQNQGGLLAQYTSGAGTTSRIDPVVDFPLQNTNSDIYGSGLAAPGNHFFNIEWQGTVLIDTAGDWTFRVDHDDIARLWIDEEPLIIDTTSGDPVVSDTGTMPLTAGWHAIRLRIENRSWDSNQEARLWWQSATQTLEIIPQDHLNPAGNLGDVTGPAIVSLQVTYQTDTLAAIRGVTDEQAVATLEWGTSSGSYTSSANIDVYQIDHTFGLSGLSANTTYYYRLTVTDVVGNTTVGVEQSLTTDAGPPPPNQAGLLGSYSSSGGSIERIDATIDFSLQDTNSNIYGTGLAAPGNHGWSVHWTGSVLADSAQVYTFEVEHDDTARLVIDNQQLIYNNAGDAVVNDQASVFLEAGWHEIELEVVNRSWDSNQAAFLRFDGLGSLDIIPSTHLLPRPASTSDTTPPTVTSTEALIVSDTDVIIRAFLDEVAVASVAYGKTPDSTTTVENDVYFTQHSISLTGLDPDTAYFYQVMATDLAGNVGLSAWGIFQTPRRSARAQYRGIAGDLLLEWRQPGAHRWADRFCPAVHRQQHLGHRTTRPGQPRLERTFLWLGTRRMRWRPRLYPKPRRLRPGDCGWPVGDRLLDRIGSPQKQHGEHLPESGLAHHRGVDHQPQLGQQSGGASVVRIELFY